MASQTLDSPTYATHIIKNVDRGPIDKDTLGVNRSIFDGIRGAIEGPGARTHLSRGCGIGNRTFDLKHNGCCPRDIAKVVAGLNASAAVAERILDIGIATVAAESDGWPTLNV